MNIFYTPPEQIFQDRLQLRGQEAQHASKTLRYRQGDDITVVDGQGGWYEGTISRADGQRVDVQIKSKEQREPQSPYTAVGIGIIKKKDRLEFAVEKATELGAAEIAVFRGAQSVKQNVRVDRLESTVRSAMKQSLRAWLPEVNVFRSLQGLVECYSNTKIWLAHQSSSTSLNIAEQPANSTHLLLTGPEGDFSDEELQLLRDQQATFISLGNHRLRTETAAVTFLNSFLLLSR